MSATSPSGTITGIVGHPRRDTHMDCGVWRAAKITVLQAMGMSTDVSATTAHRRLNSLRKKRDHMVPDDVANRIKYVMPTPLANQYFAQLGQCLGEAQAA